MSISFIAIDSYSVALPPGHQVTIYLSPKLCESDSAYIYKHFFCIGDIKKMIFSDIFPYNRVHVLGSNTHMVHLEKEIWFIFTNI